MKGYVKFINITTTAQKTKVWHVESKHDETIIGAVAWHSPWRRYVFKPRGNTLFDASCLTLIASFCGERTQEQKQTWKTNKDKLG
jgi:hypothetical protein